MGPKLLASRPTGSAALSSAAALRTRARGQGSQPLPTPKPQAAADVGEATVTAVVAVLAAVAQQRAQLEEEEPSAGVADEGWPGTQRRVEGPIPPSAEVPLLDAVPTEVVAVAAAAEVGVVEGTRVGSAAVVVPPEPLAGEAAVEWTPKCVSIAAHEAPPSLLSDKPAVPRQAAADVAHQEAGIRVVARAAAGLAAAEAQMAVAI